MPKSKRPHRPAPGAHKPAPELSTKARGELSQLTFLYRAAHKGFMVSEPYGDNLRYDAIVDNGHRLSRIQVKSSGKEISPGRYHVNCGRRLGLGAVPYEKGEVDFLAVHLHREDVWYIIPFRAFAGRVSLTLVVPNHPGPCPYQRYLEAWPLLKK